MDGPVLALAPVLALVTLGLPETEYFVLGTAIALPEEAEPQEGRILVFSVHGHTLELVCELTVQGAVYDLCTTQSGRLIAGVNSRVYTLAWSTQAAQPKLIQEHVHTQHILALYVKSRGDFVIVGDLMKSISLLRYVAADDGTGSLELVASDCNSNWMTAIEMWDDKVLLLPVLLHL